MEQLSKRLMNWASILDPQTRDQAFTTSKMPFIYPHIALMPDAHLGMGATVGSVIPTQGAIMPAAIGVDIGCSVRAVRTQFTIEDTHGRDKSKLREAIERAVPLGPGMYNSEIKGDTEARIAELEQHAEGLNVKPDAYAKNWREQLGSLGGGNHFIEVVVDDIDRIWLFLHSGSRGVGNKIAQHHIKLALEQCRKRFIDLPNPDLAYLVEGEETFWNYIHDMWWAQAFAKNNLKEMMARIEKCVSDWFGEQVQDLVGINCHHNYTTQEEHFGEKVWLSRKGAIDAHEGVMGLIPGSMGTASYVVRGKGNKLALHSSPHGAGRNFSRRKAKENFDYELLRKRMEGIEWRDSESFLDEIPDAYKSIDIVMQDAHDLVEIVNEFRQLVNCKGT